MTLVSEAIPLAAVLILLLIIIKILAEWMEME